MTRHRIPHTEPLSESKVKYTPGPWYPSCSGHAVCAVHPTRDRSATVNLDSEIRYYGGYLVCESVGKKGDAALMAAAPDMYELLHKMHDWLAVSGTSFQSMEMQSEIQELFFEVWRMGDFE